MKKFALTFVLTLFFSASVFAQSFNAKVNRNSVPLGETFVLTLEYDAMPEAGQNPDISPLSDSFVVYSVENSFSSSYSKGVSKRKYQWNVALSPKETGNVTVPAIKLGNLSTKPIQIKVVDTLAAGTVSADAGPKFSISRVIDNPHPLVQEQIRYKLTISATEDLQGKEPMFLLTNENDWIIRGLGQPKMRSEIVDGIEIKKFDIEYALFPQRSGELVIPEVRFEGYYVNPDAPRKMSSLRSLLDGSAWGPDGFGFDSMLPKTPVYLTARPISVKVGKIPEANGGKWWMPAKSVEITSDWDNEIPRFVAGEAVDRKIYIKATGVIDNQMPKLDMPSSTDLKQYPEKPSFEGDVKSGDVVSVMTINNVYIPQKSGNITIPAIKVDWYNVETKNMEQAVLPELKVNVAKGNQLEAEEEVAPIDKTTIEKIEAGNITWIYIAVAFVLGLLLSYVLFKPKKSKFETKPEEKKKEETVCVSKAFKGDDLKAMRDSVLAWARNFYADVDNISNLNDVANLTQDAEFKKQLDMLNKALYSGNNCNFNTGEFLIVFDKISRKQKKAKKAKEKLLPDLYK